MALWSMYNIVRVNSENSRLARCSPWVDLENEDYNAAAAGLAESLGRPAKCSQQSGPVADEIVALRYAPGPPSCIIIVLVVERLIVIGRKVENGTKHQESRGAPDGRGIIEVDRGEHDNSSRNGAS